MQWSRRASACDLLKRALLLPWGKQAHAETQVPALALTADKRCAVHADASGGQWRGSVAILHTLQCRHAPPGRSSRVLCMKQLRGWRWWSGLWTRLVVFSRKWKSLLAAMCDVRCSARAGKWGTRDFLEAFWRELGIVSGAGMSPPRIFLDIPVPRSP